MTQGMRSGSALIVTDTLAYLLDSAQLRVVTWNPSTMAIGALCGLA